MVYALEQLNHYTIYLWLYSESSDWSQTTDDYLEKVNSSIQPKTTTIT